MIIDNTGTLSKNSFGGKNGTGTLKVEREHNHEDHFKTDHLLRDLRGRTISSGAITICAQGAKFVLNLGSVMILARLLTPSDFGLVAMVTTITGFVLAFKDLGLSTATVQQEQITHAQVSNLFWINVAVSVLSSTIVAISAPVIAWFYRDPRLIVITLLLSTTFIISGSTVQHQALLKRQMRFKALAIVEVGSMAVGVLVGIIMAFRGYGYWSLVALNLVMELAALLLTWLASRWRPQLPKRGSKTGPLVRFGANLTMGSLISAIARGSDNLLIGRAYGSASVGLYSRASALLMRPLEHFFAPVSSVFIPALSRLQSQPTRYRIVFLNVYEAIAVTGFFFSGLLLPVARPLTLVLLGPKWEQASLILGGFTLSAFFIPLGTAVLWLFTSQGRGRDLLIVQILNSLAMVASFIAGLPYGPVGVALAFTISNVIIRLPIFYFVVGRRGPIKTSDLWATFFRHLPVWIVVFVTSWLTHLLVINQMPIIQLLSCIIVGGAAGVAFISTMTPQRRVAMYLLRNSREVFGKVVVRLVPKRIMGKRTAYVFSDSHGLVFDHLNVRHPFSKLHFDVTEVSGATAQGLVNPNAQTNSLEIFQSKIDTISDKNAPLLFLLGEVDTGFVIWYRAQKYGETIESQLDRSIRNYFSFLRGVQQQGFHNIVIVSAPLPTIRDNQTWGQIANLRKEVKATQRERTELTLKYNARLRDLCLTHGFSFLDCDEQLLDTRTGIVKETFLNSDRNNHHLDNDQYCAVCYQWLRTNQLL